MTPPREGTRLITLGTLGGPSPRAHRAQSSNLIIVNGSLYVVDAGDGVARRLAKAGIALRDIATIFITHHHDDHTAGLGTLMIAAWNQHRNKPINVFGPPGTQKLVEAAVQYFSLSSELRIADGGHSIPIAQVFFGHDVSVGMAYGDENIKVTAVENTHFDFHRSGHGSVSSKSFSYRFETPDRVIAFAVDTGPSRAVTQLADGADLLVVGANSPDDRMQAMVLDGRWQAMKEEERTGLLQQATRGHSTLEEIGKMATSAGAKAVVLTHLTYRPPPHTEDYLPWANEVQRHFNGQVFIADDLMEF